MTNAINTILLFCFVILANTLLAQNENSINFSFSNGTKNFNFNDTSYLQKDSNNVQINELKFYISKVQFLKNGTTVLEEKNSFHLIDATEKKTCTISIVNNENIVYDELKFNLGIDSTTNVSGVMGGDLDPTKGMYWTWQSGYINLKLEGTSKLCKTRNNEFTFHLGGYQQPFYALQTLSFQLNNFTQINLKLDVQEILKQIDLTKQNHIMSPSAEAMMISKIISNAFKISEN